MEERERVGARRGKQLVRFRFLSLSELSSAYKYTAIGLRHKQRDSPPFLSSVRLLLACSYSYNPLEIDMNLEFESHLIFEMSFSKLRQLDPYFPHKSIFDLISSLFSFCRQETAS